MNKICRVFNEIGKILLQVNGKQKRMINLKFILRKMFEMMGLTYDNIQISKSKKPLAFYQEYWDNILLLVGNEIKSIVGIP